LQYLVDRAGSLVMQAELLEALWPDTFVQPEVLKTHIGGIRNALGDDPKHPKFIETLPRRGYRFIAPVCEPISPIPDASVSPLPLGRRGFSRGSPSDADGKPNDSSNSSSGPVTLTLQSLDSAAERVEELSRAQPN
jgi:DNA-binding winged helix-turn-helix (wHTH) protein